MPQHDSHPTDVLMPPMSKLAFIAAVLQDEDHLCLDGDAVFGLHQILLEIRDDLEEVFMLVDDTPTKTTTTKEEN